MTMWPQLTQAVRRWLRPLRWPHLHSQLPMEKSTNSSSRDVAEVGDREDGGEDGLQSVVLALLGQLIHLQKALVAAALHFDQVGNLDGGWDLGKIETAADRAHCSLLDMLTPETRTFEASRGAAGIDAAVSSRGESARSWLSGFGSDCAAAECLRVAAALDCSADPVRRMSLPCHLCDVYCDKLQKLFIGELARAARSCYKERVREALAATGAGMLKTRQSARRDSVSHERKDRLVHCFDHR